MEDPEQAFVEYASSRTDEAGADGTKSYPVGIVKDVEVLIRKLKLLNDFYVIDMKKDLETPMLVGRGFLAIANAVIDYRRAKIAVGERITRKDFLDCHLSGEWQIARDAELNPFKDTLVFRRMGVVKLLVEVPYNNRNTMCLILVGSRQPIGERLPRLRDHAYVRQLCTSENRGQSFVLVGSTKYHVLSCSSEAYSTLRKLWVPRRLEALFWIDFVVYWWISLR
nr:hypothetical protein [Tanacetum cinerariifolium]